MKTVLVVSPHFPPINAADMHRVRMSVGHFREFGWNPLILSVSPEHVEGVHEPLLNSTLDSELHVCRVSALSAKLTRRFGLGNLGVRAFPFLYRAGARLIRKHSVDLVYFSTTVFTVMPLGKMWKKKFGIPFVVDMQDPWLSDYYDQHPDQKPPKYWAAANLHRRLEPWTMPDASGLIAVSTDYIDILKVRYPALGDVPAKTLPFGAAHDDFNILRRNPQPNRFFDQNDGLIHGVYVGRGGHDMSTALRLIFNALRRGLDELPNLFSKVRLHFVGTDYAPPDQVKKTILPVATECGVAEFVDEHPARIPYFEGLQLLLDSQFLIVPGSEDSQYTASKIYPYILAKKPLLAVFHERSGVCKLIESTNSGHLVPFVTGNNGETFSCQAFYALVHLLKELPFHPATDWNAFQPYSAVENARRQCELFSQVMSSLSN